MIELWPLILIPITAISMLSITWTHSRGAPWVPSSMREVRKMLTLAGVGPNDTVYDLGCGDGRMVVTAARRFGAHAVGIEIDPLRYTWCQLLITVLGLRDRVRIIFGDFFNQDLGDADVITCYLLQDTNNKLERKLTHELQPSSRVVSHDFTFPGLQLVRHDKKDDLYLYHPVPAK